MEKGIEDQLVMENGIEDRLVMENSIEDQLVMFEPDEDEAYAGTEADVWQAMRFFNNLKVVAFNELKPEDRTCLICFQPYDDPEEEEVSHVPVQLPCSHILGKECLACWITPFGAWKDDRNGDWEDEHDWFENPLVEYTGLANCPICRKQLFQIPNYAESAMGLESRLIFFDRAYEKVGCLRSEKEEQSRADLIRYGEFHRMATMENRKRSTDERWTELEKFHCTAKSRLYYFVVWHRAENVLTPSQARFLLNLKNVSIYGLGTLLDDPEFEEFVGSEDLCLEDFENHDSGAADDDRAVEEGNHNIDLEDGNVSSDMENHDDGHDEDRPHHEGDAVQQ